MSSYLFHCYFNSVAELKQHFAVQPYSHIEWLDNNGYKTAKNRSFCATTIKGILENEKYCGTFFWDKKSAKDFRGKRNSHKIKEEYIRIKNGCPAIVSEEIFNKAQERLKDSKNKIRNHNGKNYYPMNGKIFCKQCGSELKGKVQYSRTNKDNKPTKQYKLSCKCHAVKTVNEKYLDDMIIYGLRECIFSPINTDEILRRLNEYAEEQNKENDLQIDILKSEKAGIQKRQNNLIKLVETGNDTESVREKIKEMEIQIKEINDKIYKFETTKKTFTPDDIRMIKNG